MLKQSNVGVFTLPKTHYATKGKLQIEGFEVVEAIGKREKGVL